MNDKKRNLTEKEREQYYQLLYSNIQCVSNAERKEWDRLIVERNLAYKEDTKS